MEFDAYIMEQIAHHSRLFGERKNSLDVMWNACESISRLHKEAEVAGKLISPLRFTTHFVYLYNYT